MTLPPMGPLNVPGMPMPDPDEGKRWYRRWFMWLLVAGVAIGALLNR